MMDIRIDTKEIERLKNALTIFPKAFDKAMKYAVKRAGSAMSSEMSKQVSEQYTVKRAKFRRAVTMKHEAGAVTLITRGKPVKLSEYRITPTKTPHKRQPRGYLKYEIRRGEIETAESGFLRGYGKNIPTERTGRGRRDIRNLKGPAMPELAGESKVNRPVIEKAREQFMQQLRYHAMKEIGVIK